MKVNKENPKKTPLEIYIHIPFCVRKCKYCDFLSAPCREEERSAYVVSLCEQIRQCDLNTEAYGVVSIFVGGGTPSLLSPEEIKMVFRAVRERFKVEGDAEVTLEANPGTLNEEKLVAYQSVGINRLSLGLQSIHEKELALLGRIHDYPAFLESYRMARRLGFSNINVDLMMALPHQTLSLWMESLKTVAGLSPEHISAYSLILEEGTPFYETYGKPENVHLLPDEDAERKMYEETILFLKKCGYEQYEISNFAKPGYECRHNIGYWERREYIGFGVGAASLIGNRRFTNGTTVSTMNDRTTTILTRENEMEEYMFLGLRKTKGISISKFEDQFGIPLTKVYKDVIDKYEKCGMLTRKEDALSLSKEGVLVSNYILSDFLLD